MKKIYFELLMYMAVIVTCFVILIWAIRLLELDFSVPFGYAGSDNLLIDVVAKSIVDNGWYYENPYLGMPYGQNYYDFSYVDVFN